MISLLHMRKLGLRHVIRIHSLISSRAVTQAQAFCLRAQFPFIKINCLMRKQAARVGRSFLSQERSEAGKCARRAGQGWHLGLGVGLHDLGDLCCFWTLRRPLFLLGYCPLATSIERFLPLPAGRRGKAGPLSIRAAVTLPRSFFPCPQGLALSHEHYL